MIVKNTKPIISACIISYNQQDYIAQALEGALMQELDVPYEIVVSDDCSTDNTPQIIAAYAKKDARIRVLKHATNQGMHRNWQQAIATCTGTYIALCEGDDYWTDVHKLAKQHAILDTQPALSGCFTNADICSFEGKHLPSQYVSLQHTNWTAEQLLSLYYNPVPTCTLFFRRAHFNGFPAAYFKSPFADRVLHTLLIQQGDYQLLPEATAVYRQHSSGVWSGQHLHQQHQSLLKSLRIIEQLIPQQQQKQWVQQAIRQQLDRMLYHYRAERSVVNYLKTWLQLKAMH